MGDEDRPRKGKQRIGCVLVCIMCALVGAALGFILNLIPRWVVYGVFGIIIGLVILYLILAGIAEWRKIFPPVERITRVNNPPIDMSNPPGWGDTGARPRRAPMARNPTIAMPAPQTQTPRPKPQAPKQENPGRRIIR